MVGLVGWDPYVVAYKAKLATAGEGHVRRPWGCFLIIVHITRRAVAKRWPLKVRFPLKI